jgi:transcriptional regulator with XRE-family HTH domain
MLVAKTQPQATKEELKRKELAAFLRSRRERVKTIPKAFTSLSRRRTPGLRREEVAELAAVGTAWYTWLEQARDIQPSAEVLERIGKALALTPSEMRHLFCLAGKPSNSDRSPKWSTIPKTLVDLLDQAIQAPALVLNAEMESLYWNSNFSDSIVDLDSIPEDQRNWFHFIFCNKDFKSRIENWETHAQDIIGIFRAAAVNHVGSPWFTALLNRIKEENKKFSDWWDRYDVHDRRIFFFNLKHPLKGHLPFEVSFLIPTDAPELRVVVFNLRKPSN